MENIKWCENMLKDKEAQALLEEKVQILIDMFFKGKRDYAIEKFIKSFGEGLIYLENTLLKDRGIHPSQIQENMIYLSAHPEETAKKIKEVQDKMKMEINRQYRHFQTFLSEIVS
jgi:flagella basal body P-ring formation protein FlgA